MSKPNELPFETTLHVRDHCMCLHVQRAARALARRFDEALKPHGLTNQQFSLLMSLNRPAPPRMKEVALLLALDRTTLTANLKVLERRGLARSDPDPGDRRSRLLILTDDGRRMLVAALPAWKRTESDIEALLVRGGPDDLRANLKALS
ncbi:MAG: MarR family transcriptional regulator [Rhizobiaceae bacterium]|nr:MarR family transcriptional regulator [Rhizobiaceae bacterium]